MYGGCIGAASSALPFRQRPTRRELLALGATLVSALALRLWNIDLAQLRYDEAAAASLVAAWREHGQFPLTGIVSSVGIPNPPAWPYVLALGLLAAPSPAALVAVGVVAGMTGVLLAWAVGRRWLGPLGGIVAALFLAVGFWPTLLGRGAWQPAFLMPVVLLCLDALLLLALGRRPDAFVFACGWLALMVQLHYVALCYVLVLGVATWMGRRSLRPVHVLAGACLFVALLAPFLLYELHPDVRFRDLRHMLVLAGGSPSLDLQGLAFAWDLAGGGNLDDLSYRSGQDLSVLARAWGTLAVAGSVLAFCGIVVAGVRRPGGSAGALLLLWVGLPILLLVRHTVDISYHYLYVTLPAFALGAGALAAWAKESSETPPPNPLPGEGENSFLLGATPPGPPGSARGRESALGSTLAGARTSRRTVGHRGALGLTVVALTSYAVGSVGILVTLLSLASTMDTQHGYGIPMRYPVQAGQVARALRQPESAVLIGGHRRDVEILRFTIGYDVPTRVFEDCSDVPYAPGAVYLLLSERTPGAAALAEAGATVLTRVPRPGGDAYLIVGALPRPGDLNGLAQRPEHDSAVCRDRQA